MKVWTLCLSLILAISASAQEVDSFMHKQNALYWDIAGAGGLTSVNYEYSYLKSAFVELQATFGLSTFKVIDFTRKFNPDIIVPVSTQALIGRKKHKLVLGIGSTINNMVIANKSGKTRYTSLNGFGRLGYRQNNKQEKFYWQFAYTPLFINKSGFRHWGSFTLAYKF